MHFRLNGDDILLKAFVFQIEETVKNELTCAEVLEWCKSFINDETILARIEGQLCCFFVALDAYLTSSSRSMSL